MSDVQVAAPDDETYKIGVDDGRTEMAREIDLATGGDGEFRYCMNGDPDRHCPDADAMKARIIARLATRPAPVGEPVAWMYAHPKLGCYTDIKRRFTHPGWTETPLYTRPALDVDGLVEALRECAEDLEVEVRSRFIDRDTGLPHPANQRRYDRDMVPVRKARACLAAIKDATDG